MNEETLRRIKELQDEQCHWSSQPVIKHKDIDVNLCQLIGDSAILPVDVPDQPGPYPKGLPRKDFTYMFDPDLYCGPESFEDIEAMLKKSCPGCTLFRQRVDAKGQPGFVKYQLCCGYYKVEDGNSKFEEGNFTKEGVNKIHVKQKSNAKKTFDKMEHTSFKKSPPRKKKRLHIVDRRDGDSKAVYGQAKPKQAKKRSSTARAPNKESRCLMNFQIFMSKISGKYYLSKNTNFQHGYHPKADIDSTTLNRDDLSEDQVNFMRLMNDYSIPDTTIAHIMTGVLNSEGKKGEFLGSTIKNMNTTIDKAMELMNGISADMSVAEKTIKSLNELGVSYVYLTMHPDGDLLVRSGRGRRTKEEVEKMTCPDYLRKELETLREELGFKEGTEILLALSFASDEMIRAMHMFPEVMYKDVTENTNKQKRGLFLVVVKDRNGQTFIGNATMIPSGKKWVFTRIYQSFFIHLYGETTMSRCRLSLTDDDICEHGPMDNCIKTMSCYSKSTHMLCVFHAIVMAFHEKIYPKLPRKTKARRELSDDGEVYGFLFYLWLLSQCTDCETKEEYDRSHKELTKFLGREDVIEILGSDCINAMVELQTSAKDKESKLAGYIRMDIKNSNDACTTSPVESNNNAVKHGSSKITSRMNLDKSVKRLLRGINTRLRRRHHAAKREMGMNNQASRAPTKDYVIAMAQGRMDTKYDARHNCKHAMLSPNHHLVWDFDEEDTKKIKHEIQVCLPKFMRVRELSVAEHHSGKTFVTCSCCVRIREGSPCTCFWKVADDAGIPEAEIMDLGMIDVTYLKAYNAHYGAVEEVSKGVLKPTEMAAYLYEAQEDCFRYEKNGTMVSRNFAEKINGDTTVEYPFLFPGTTQNDFEEALFVLRHDACTRYDLAEFRMMVDETLDQSGFDFDFDTDEDDEDNNEDCLKVGMKREAVHISGNAKAMMEGVAASYMDPEEAEELDDKLPTEEEKGDLRSRWVSSVTNVLNCQRGSLRVKLSFGRQLADIVGNYWKEVNERWGYRGGGEGRLLLGSETITTAKVPKRARGAL